MPSISTATPSAASSSTATRQPISHFFALLGGGGGTGSGEDMPESYASSPRNGQHEGDHLPQPPLQYLAQHAGADARGRRRADGGRVPQGPAIQDATEEADQGRGHFRARGGAPQGGGLRRAEA